ncbi:MAG: hypothetical protein D6781_08780, partial [Verrucomicrobia bacterium]
MTSSRHAFLRVVGLFAASVAFLAGAFTEVLAQTYSQDGYSFSGTVTQTPIGDTVAMTGNSAFPGDANIGTIHFRGAVTDGTNLWLAPADADRIIRVNKATGAMTGFTIPDVGTTSEQFVGGVYDGTYIWFVPFGATKVLRVDPTSGSRTTFAGWPSGHNVTANGANFAGGVFDGTYIWLVPLNANMVVRIDPADGSMTGFNTWPGSFSKGSNSFWGGVFDGSKLWLIPFDADRVISVNTADGSMAEHLGWPAGFTKNTQAFAGGTFDGTYVWLAPYNADRVIRINVADGSMEGFNTWPSGFTKANAAFAGAVYDGDDIWLVPFSADRVVKLDKATGAMSAHANWPSGFTKGAGAFAGAVYEDQTIWMVPAEADRIVALTDTPVPAVTSITRQNPTAADTNADTVVFRVTFNKNVNNVDVSDFTLTVGGTASGTISAVSAASGSTIDVTVTSVAGDGSMRLDLNASGTGIEDDYQNAISGGFTAGESYNIDNTAPVITSASTASGVYRQALTYTITASGGATAFGASGLPAGLSVNSGTGEISGTPTTSGVFNATITASDVAGNVGSANLEITLAKAPLTISGVTANNKIYDGTTAATLNTGSAALVGVASGDDVVLDASAAAGTFADKNIGAGKTVTITGFAITGADAGHYSLTQPSATADIAAATLSVSGITAADKVYDGTTAATISTSGATLVGVVSGDSVTLDTSMATGSFASKTVGSGKTVTISGVSFGGPDAGNYVLSPVTTTASITPAPLSVTGVTALDRDYDGTTAATLDLSGASLVGVVSGDTVVLDTSGASGSFADKTAGANKPVTITGITISGADAGNYALTQPSATATINKLTITVSGVVANSRVYDATTTATLDTSAATLVGVVSGDVVSLDASGASASFADKNVGNARPVTVSGLALSGADAGNYTLTQPSLTADITPASLAVTGITAADKVYDGTTAATVSTSGASVTPVFPGDDVSLDTSSVTASFADKTVGANKIVTIAGLALSGADAGNYALTAPTVTADITPAAVTVSGIVANDKVYDGTATTTIDASGASLSGVLTGDDVSLVTSGASGSFADKNVGSNKPVTIVGLSLGGADGGNYTITAPTTTAHITKKPLTVTGVTAADKTYDGTTAATIDTSAAALVGVVSGDDVTLDASGATGEFDNAAAGTGKTVHISGLALAGADAPNYQLVQPTATASINKATATVSLSGLAQTYDGTAKTVTATTDPAGLTVNITYDGSAAAPTNAGSYAVVATVSDANYEGQATGTLVISKAPVSVEITGIYQIADGSPKPVTVTTDPSGLAVEVTYDGSTTVPSAIGRYEVIATIVDDNYAGTATETLVIDSNTRPVNL